MSAAEKAEGPADLILAEQAAREFNIPPHVLADLWAKDRISTWWFGDLVFVDRDEMELLAVAGWVTGGGE